MPGAFQTNSIGGVPSTTALPAVRSFASGESPVFEYPYAIGGTTKDASGAALASCAVVLYRTTDNSVAAQGTSDVNGVYLLSASPSITHYLVAYKAGSPDVAGVTLNTLVGS